MSVIITELNAKIFLELTPGEAGLLDAICGYGPEKFKEWFKKNLGKHYIEKYEQHMDSLFEKARKLEIAVKNYNEAVKHVRRIEV